MWPVPVLLQRNSEIGLITLIHEWPQRLSSVTQPFLTKSSVSKVTAPHQCWNGKYNDIFIPDTATLAYLQKIKSIPENEPSINLWAGISHKKVLIQCIPSFQVNGVTCTFCNQSFLKWWIAHPGYRVKIDNLQWSWPVGPCRYAYFFAGHQISNRRRSAEAHDRNKL